MQVRAGRCLFLVAVSCEPFLPDSPPVPATPPTALSGEAVSWCRPVRAPWAALPSGRAVFLLEGGLLLGSHLAVRPGLGLRRPPLTVPSAGLGVFQTLREGRGPWVCFAQTAGSRELLGGTCRLSVAAVQRAAVGESWQCFPVLGLRSGDRHAARQVPVVGRRSLCH